MMIGGITGWLAEGFTLQVIEDSNPRLVIFLAEIDQIPIRGGVKIPK